MHIELLPTHSPKVYSTSFHNFNSENYFEWYRKKRIELHWYICTYMTPIAPGFSNLLVFYEMMFHIHAIIHPKERWINTIKRGKRGEWKYIKLTHSHIPNTKTENFLKFYFSRYSLFFPYWFVKNTVSSFSNYKYNCSIRFGFPSLEKSS